MHTLRNEVFGNVPLITYFRGSFLWEWFFLGKCSLKYCALGKTVFSRTRLIFFLQQRTVYFIDFMEKYF